MLKDFRYRDSVLCLTFAIATIGGIYVYDTSATLHALGYLISAACAFPTAYLLADIATDPRGEHRNVRQPSTFTF